MENPRGISVVTPTRGRVSLVASLLTSLQKCAKGADFDVDVIVVDDSEHSEAVAIRDLCDNAGARYFEGPRVVGKKRNIGAKNAKHDVVLFIDSDCVATDRLLHEHLAAHDNAPRDAAAVAGPTTFYGDTNFSARITERSMVYEAFDAPRTHQRILWGTTSNLSVQRDVFLSVGGFCETPLTVVGGEDVDLGVRLDNAGYHIVTAPDGIAQHARTSGPAIWRSLTKLFTYGQADNWLCERHEEYVVYHPNPIILGMVGAAAGILWPAGRRGRATTALICLPLAVCGARELSRRYRMKKHVDLRDLAATVMDWSYDLGVAVGAFRAGTPGQSITRFDYHPPAKFSPFVQHSATDEK